MNYTILDAGLMFFLYGFLGWCLEVVFCGLQEGHFINRGFLNGPICPIYGVGGTIVILCLTPIKKHFFLLFIVSIILTSALEYLTGWVLEKIYHVRWWDYSDKPFNINGYICPLFSLGWGIACTALMYGIHPVLYGLIYKLPWIIKLAAVIILLVLIIIDLTVTVITLKNFSVKIRALEDAAKRMHDLSDNVGEFIYEKAENGVKKGEAFKESKEGRELREKYETLIEDFGAMQKRIINAFPKMNSRKNSSVLAHIKEKHLKFKDKIKNK